MSRTFQLAGIVDARAKPSEFHDFSSTYPSHNSSENLTSVINTPLPFTRETVRGDAHEAFLVNNGLCGRYVVPLKNEICGER